MIRLFICLLFSLLLVDGMAQCCSGGVPIAGNLSLPSGGSKESQIQLTYDYNRLRALFFEAENLDDNTRQRSTHSILLESSYGFTPKWSVSNLLFYVVQERIIETRPGERQFTQTQGIGDWVILLRYTLINNEKLGLSLGAGPKLPTGKNDIRDDNNLWLSADLQPGSGAWDAMLWSSFSFYDIFKKNLGFSLTSTGRITGTADRLEGTQTYKFGDEFQVYGGLSDRYLIGKMLIDPQLLFRYRYVSEDIVNGLPLPNTGGSFFHVVPAAIFSINSKTSLRIAAEFPLYRQVIGTQLATSSKVTASLFFRITPKQEITPFQIP
ncbi:MAG: hypothetical protein AAFY71_14000 [Bacteroidota bacterium]